MVCRLLKCFVHSSHNIAFSNDVFVALSSVQRAARTASTDFCLLLYVKHLVVKVLLQFSVCGAASICAKGGVFDDVHCKCDCQLPWRGNTCESEYMMTSSNLAMASNQKLNVVVSCLLRFQIVHAHLW